VEGEAISDLARGEVVDRTPLLPVRHPNQDLFICDILDAIPKDDMASMEHPVFSLSTKPDRATRHYEHRGARIDIVPSGMGLATIHDKDVLIYCISQLIAKMNKGETPQRRLRLRAYDLLVATNRQTSGEGYRLLGDALTRLRGTTIRTNIKTGGEEETRVFGLIEEASISRKTFDGRMQDIEVTLSEWVYRSVISKNVLTLHRDYFRLRKPLERRMYELARKHCGQQGEWNIGLELLQKKCGASSPLNVFRAMVKRVCEHDAAHQHFPDYEVRFDNDIVKFRNRSACLLEGQGVEDNERPHIDPEALHDAKLAAPGYDIYALLEEWVMWWRDSGKPDLKSPAAAFIGFCKRRHERKPLGERRNSRDDW
jgi:hypothetical protein